jgi:serine-type D-Ala-D-Ala endopeptidase (penicillin-binding protein 7)
LIYIDLYFFWGILLSVWFLSEHEMKKILLICVLAGNALIAQAGENDGNASGENQAKPAARHHLKHHKKSHHKTVHHRKTLHHHAAHTQASQSEPAPDQSAKVAAILDASPVAEPNARTAAEQPALEKHDKLIAAPDARLAMKYDTRLSLFQPHSSPKLRSSFALVYDEATQRPLYTKNPDQITPIASITKLMTAMVVLDSRPDMDEEIRVSEADLDMLKGTHSRLSVGTTFTRREMLNLALMSSENRAASALARYYPGGKEAAVAAMNAKARELGMTNTMFRDPTGLNSQNVSTARDLVKMVSAARQYKLIHQFTTTASRIMEATRGRELLFHNTNPLVKSTSWEIGLSKTGFINEAGRCLVMQAQIRQRPVIIVLLDSVGKSSRIGDANRVKKWIESASAQSVSMHRG